MWKSVRASFIYRKNGEKWKKELEKEEKQENGKSRKADKNKEISYMWKNGKNQENERIILTKWHFMLIIKYDV